MVAVGRRVGFVLNTKCRVLKDSTEKHLTTKREGYREREIEREKIVRETAHLGAQQNTAVRERAIIQLFVCM